MKWSSRRSSRRRGKRADTHQICFAGSRRLFDVLRVTALDSQLDLNSNRPGGLSTAKGRAHFLLCINVCLCSVRLMYMVSAFWDRIQARTAAKTQRARRVVGLTQLFNAIPSSWVAQSRL